MSTAKYQVVLWISTILTIVGVFLNAEKNYLCWVFYMMGNMGFLLYFTKKREWAMVVLNCVYVTINLWGLYKWIG